MSRGVVENQTECEALARPHRRDSMPHRRRRPSAGRTHRPFTRREDEAVAEWQQCRGAARLCARTLLDEQELTAGVVDTRFAEVDHDLQRKHQVAVEIPMQRVPVTLAVLEQDRGRLGLAGRMADAQPIVEVVGPRGPPAQFGPPFPGDRQQSRVQRLLERLDRLWIRLLEVPVLTFAEPVSAHVDRRAEQVVVEIAPPDCLGLGVGEQPGQQCATEVVDLSGDCVPVARVDAFLPLRRSHQNSLAAFTSLGSSKSSRNCLTLSPPAYPVSWPVRWKLRPTTRWHATMMLSGLRPTACPTSWAVTPSARAAASSPYVTVSP